MICFGLAVGAKGEWRGEGSCPHFLGNCYEIKEGWLRFRLTLPAKAACPRLSKAANEDRTGGAGRSSTNISGLPEMRYFFWGTFPVNLKTR